MVLATRRRKSECSTSHSELNTYFFEFLWRMKFEYSDPFVVISVTIASVYTLE